MSQITVNKNSLTEEQKQMLRSWFAPRALNVSLSFDVEMYEDFDIYADLVALNDFVTLNEEVNKFVHSMVLDANRSE